MRSADGLAGIIGYVSFHGGFIGGLMAGHGLGPANADLSMSKPLLKQWLTSEPLERTKDLFAARCGEQEGVA
jgi:hypothetical protein